VARDRKRAKQRRDRARRTAGTTAVSPRARRDQEAPRDEAPREEAPREAEATPEAAPETADFTDEHVPLSLEHASADVDIAEAQLAAGYADAGPFDGQEDDGFIAPDELDDEADRVAGPQQGGRRPDGAAVPARREHHVPGNRVIGFLQASWRELQRVQWPDRRQVAQATGVVLVFCLIAGAFLGLADEVAARLVDALL
jgi:preprotein translocase subunit SecE